MSYSRGLVCLSCDHLYSENEFKLTCPECGSPLEVSYDLDAIHRLLKRGWPQPNGATLLKQWEKLLPFTQSGLITRCSLGETQTPLIRANKAGANMGLDELQFKVEIGPTLSLKDRGSSLCSLKALEMVLKPCVWHLRATTPVRLPLMRPEPVCPQLYSYSEMPLLQNLPRCWLMALKWCALTVT